MNIVVNKAVNCGNTTARQVAAVQSSVVQTFRYFDADISPKLLHFCFIDHGASILRAEYFHQVMGSNSFVGKSEQKNLNELAFL